MANDIVLQRVGKLLTSEVLKQLVEEHEELFPRDARGRALVDEWQPGASAIFLASRLSNVQRINDWVIWQTAEILDLLRQPAYEGQNNRELWQEHPDAVNYPVFVKQRRGESLDEYEARYDEAKEQAFQRWVQDRLGMGRRQANEFFNLHYRLLKRLREADPNITIREVGRLVKALPVANAITGEGRQRPSSDSQASSQRYREHAATSLREEGVEQPTERQVQNRALLDMAKDVDEAPSRDEAMRRLYQRNEPQEVTLLRYHRQLVIVVEESEEEPGEEVEVERYWTLTFEQLTEPELRLIQSRISDIAYGNDEEFE